MKPHTTLLFLSLALLLVSCLSASVRSQAKADVDYGREMDESFQKARRCALYSCSLFNKLRLGGGSGSQLRGRYRYRSGGYRFRNGAGRRDDIDNGLKLRDLEDK